jgi:hypothetical protein
MQPTTNPRRGYFAAHAITETGQPGELSTLLAGWRPDDRELALAIMVLEDTLDGREPQAVEFPVRYAPPDEIPAIADAVEAVDGVELILSVNTQGSRPRLVWLVERCKYLGITPRFVQLNLLTRESVPPPDELVEIRHDWLGEHGRVIVQQPDEAASWFDEPEDWESRFAAWLAPHAEARAVTDLLADESGGKQRLVSVRRAQRLLRAVARNSPALGLGVSGGLSPTTLKVTTPLLGEFPDLSLDAEGALHDASGRFDPRAVERFFRAAARHIALCRQSRHATEATPEGNR